MTDPAVSVFGIRHHGPGCARSLRRAFEAWRPDCVLIEGPAGAEPLLAHVAGGELQPPVAVLSHCVDDPQLAVFHPYAEFSPEWQAIRWAVEAGATVRFMDVPASASLAWQRADREGSTAHDEPQAGKSDVLVAIEPEEDSPEAYADPLDWLAHAAGYGDGESWWNHMVEERGDGADLFDAIAQAMSELRDNAGFTTRLHPGREAMREAHMRTVLRDARKQGFARIAVVCGAWHAPALSGRFTAAADKALLKDLPRLKTQTTWVPWTYRHLSMASGYGAGIASPGWYDHLWRHGARDLGGDLHARAVGWFARVASLLREHELDCSSAHLIEATRLADVLAAMRDRPAPGLEELNEATRTVLCNGDDAPMRLVAERLMIGDALGQVPADVPTVPLQRDLGSLQKRLRLKPEALSRVLDLDLRNDTDLQRSQLLHRLALLGLEWGRLSRTGRSTRGTFHEIWELVWDPQFQVEIIVASRHGHTVELAASARALEQARSAPGLPALAELVDRVLLANLPSAVDAVAAELHARAATDADPLALLGALPALANVYRYGNVRRTDVGQIAQLFDSMLLRACLGLPLATSELDAEPAEAAREVILAADRAIGLRAGEEQTAAWQRALLGVLRSATAAPLLRGMCTRLLLDANALSSGDARQQLELNLSQGVDPLPAAQWLDGFLNRNATVLLHGESIWPLIDAWLSGLDDAHFLRIVPLVRRTFAAFAAADRRDLGEKVRQPAAAPRALGGSTPDWLNARAARALPTLNELFGLEPAEPADER